MIIPLVFAVLLASLALLFGALMLAAILIGPAVAEKIDEDLDWREVAKDSGPMGCTHRQRDEEVALCE